MSKEILKFPKGFLWGGATASEQSEGHGKIGKGKTNWDLFFEKHPEKFHNQIGPSVTTDFANRYKEDIDLFQKIGANSVRIGISWARLFPTIDAIPSKEVIAYYNDVFDRLNKNGITAIINLVHFDLPAWAAEMGGWTSNDVIEKFMKFAGFCFETFGTKVKYWATFNEPNVPILGGYLFKFHWPLIQDEGLAVQASFGTILAHAKAVNLFNDKYKKRFNSKIGVIINVNPPYPKDGITFTKEDEEAAYMHDIIINQSFLSPMLKGVFPPETIKYLKDNPELMPIHTKEQLAEIAKVKLDYMGVNYYFPERVQAPPKDHKTDYKFQQFSQHYTWDDAVINVFRGWEVYPKGLYDTAMMIKEKYDNIPFFISENGMGVQDEHLYKNDQGVIQDDYRIAFLNEHLEQIHKAIQNGAHCFGYHMWAIFDCWSWCNAYKNRYGFIEINLETQERIPKKSAEWLKTSSMNNGIYKEFDKLTEVMDLTSVKFEKSS